MGMRGLVRSNHQMVWRCLVAAKRAEIGMCQRDFAERSRVRISILRQAEAGADIRLSDALAIADYLGCTLRDLWPESTTMQAPERI